MIFGRSWGIAAGILLLFPFAAAGQTYLNLDFETNSRGQPWGWMASAPSGYEVTQDSEVAFSGTGSLRIRNTGAEDPKFCSAGEYLPVETIRGKRIRVEGYVKTSGMTRGVAEYFLRMGGTDGALLGEIQWAGIEAADNRDWRQVSFEADISPDAVDVGLGVIHSGDGTAWFDAISITIDGAPFIDGVAPNTGPPTAAQLDWLMKSAYPLSSNEPSANFGDLSAVSGIVGDAHVVGVGEGTHGTSEFFLMKHRLLRYLAENKGFTIFAIEANMPEAELVNRYVLTGEGDPRRLLQGMYFWTWNTQEVLEMIQWIRAYNAAGNGPILFTGFDMQVSGVAIKNVQEFVARAEPDYRVAVAAVYSGAARVNQKFLNGVAQSAEDVQPIVDAIHLVWQHLTENRTRYLENFSARDVDWAIQNAVVVEQATFNSIAPYYYRDRSMAANMEWILSQNPGARAMIWAHNGHLAKGPQVMGSFLAAAHGTDYLVFGQIFHWGSYNAVNKGQVRASDATTSFPGTVEHTLHSTGIPRMLLDLRTASWDDAGSAWLLGPVQYRSIGALVTDGFFFSNRLVQDYDALLFVDKSTPSALLPFD